jgi:hypothetical protein
VTDECPAPAGHSIKHLDRRRRELERSAVDDVLSFRDPDECCFDVNAPVGRREGGEAPHRLLQLTFTPDAVAASGLVPRDCHVHEPLEKVPLGELRGAPRDLELLVRLEVPTLPDQLEATLERVSGHILNLPPLVAVEEGCYRHRVATILLVGVDLFFRGKLDVLLQGHHLVTTDTIAEPELVIADISRVEPEEVAETYPDIPIVGFSSHTDTAGLRRAHAAGFDQVLAKSALQERAAEVIEELLAPVE